MEDPFEIANLTKRDVPREGTAPDRDDFYSTIRQTARKLDLYDESLGQTAVIDYRFFNEDINILMEGLYGCLGVVVISHTGEF